MSLIAYIATIVAIAFAMSLVAKLFKHVQTKTGYITVTILLVAINLGMALFSLNVLNGLIANSANILFIAFVGAAALMQFVATAKRALMLVGVAATPVNELATLTGKQVQQRDVWARA